MKSRQAKNHGFQKNIFQEPTDQKSWFSEKYFKGQNTKYSRILKEQFFKDLEIYKLGFVENIL